jgi:hypothetical protein
MPWLSSGYLTEGLSARRDIADDDLELASYLRIEERELEAGGRN